MTCWTVAQDAHCLTGLANNRGRLRSLPKVGDADSRSRTGKGSHEEANFLTDTDLKVAETLGP